MTGQQIVLELLFEKLCFFRRIHARERRGLPFPNVFTVDVVVGFAAKLVYAPRGFEKFLQPFMVLSAKNNAVNVGTTADGEWSKKIFYVFGQEGAVIVYNGAMNVVEGSVLDKDFVSFEILVDFG